MNQFEEELNRLMENMTSRMEGSAQAAEHSYTASLLGQVEA